MEKRGSSFHDPPWAREIFVSVLCLIGKEVEQKTGRQSGSEDDFVSKAALKAFLCGVVYQHQAVSTQPQVADLRWPVGGWTVAVLLSQRGKVSCLKTIAS